MAESLDHTEERTPALTPLSLPAVCDPEDPPHLHPGLSIGPSSGLLLRSLLWRRAHVLFFLFLLTFVHVLILRVVAVLLKMKLLLDCTAHKESNVVRLNSAQDLLLSRMLNLSGYNKKKKIQLKVKKLFNYLQKIGIGCLVFL